MKQLQTQQLERTYLSEHVNSYTTEELKVIFRRLNPFLLRRWMNHFIAREEYEVCQVIKVVMEEKEIC